MPNVSSVRPKTGPITLFLLLAFGLAWLAAAPLWLSGQGLATPGALVLLVVMMFTPAIAARVTEWIMPSGERFTRLTTLRPRRRFRRWLPYLILAWLAPIGLSVATLALAAALGVFQADLVGFSGFAEYLETLPGGQGAPVEALVIAQLGLVLVGPVLNVIPALGEELGWRGWLQPRLSERFGQWGGSVLTGVIWALWHAPVILLGYNYPGYPALAALAFMVVSCILMSVLFGWITDASGTVWTAAVAHGFLNGAAGLGGLVVTAGHVIDPAAAGVLGYTGWIVMAGLIAVLVATRRFPTRQSALPAAAARPVGAV